MIFLERDDVGRASLFCQPCEVSFKSLEKLTLHFFTKSHLAARWTMMSTPDAYKLHVEIGNDADEALCSVCCENIAGEISEHCKTERHASAISAARKFVKFCDEKGINPTTAFSGDELKMFCETVTAEDMSSGLLNFLDQVHEKIDGRDASDVVKEFIPKAPGSC